MTTIAFKSGVMASDTQLLGGSDLHIPWSRKLRRGPDGILHGICGDYHCATEYLDWVERGYCGAEPVPGRTNNDSDYEVLIANPNGHLHLLTGYGRVKIMAPFYSIGGGSPVAFGALHAGASAIQAVEAANIYSPLSGGGVHSITFLDKD